MDSEKKNGGYTTSERLMLMLFAFSFGLYIINVLLGKASIHWGWNSFYLGNVGEFILLLVASITLIAAALHREHVEESRESNNH
ncbi:MAG: hypothetical protein HN580_00970 [Deltaproteobacteria bacterium]|jgi:hypothetical protein|nr:hypothetical protein [Deltaproteobacteria bacterium]MBT4644624.1 hypothetical protein [Deltaproteobacteria bacterium]MBT6499816.1 hypothetical protein [Deltaproteobacteria bacterium]MBT6610620.1 hypothetical protein [Deltaproteobacteria bacterium]MBT7712777.1 hypothetical protein [Deltaproteobacteria bacterium]